MRKIFILLPTLLFLYQCQNTGEQTTNTKETPKKDIKSTSDWRLDSLNARLLQDPTNAERIADRAAYMLKKGNVKDAKTDIYKALSVDSTNDRVHEVYGLIYMQGNNSRQAKDEWTKCARLNPENVNCRLFLADLYIAVKNYDEALKYVNEAIAIDEYESQPYLAKGIIIRDFKKDTTTAIQYFQKAVDLDQKT